MGLARHIISKILGLPSTGYPKVQCVLLGPTKALLGPLLLWAYHDMSC